MIVCGREKIYFNEQMRLVRLDVKKLAKINILYFLWMVDLSMFIIALTVMLLATICIYLSAVDVIATEYIKSDNVLYTRYIIEFPSEILWITGKSYNLDINESSNFNSSHYGQALLVIQTVNGNVHTVDVADTSIPDYSQSITHSNISTFKVNASDDTGGPIITDLADSNYEVVLTTANGSLAIIDYRKALMVYNGSIKFSTQTQIVPYLRNLKGESRSLLGVSENGTLLMIEPTIMNNQNA